MRHNWTSVYLSLGGNLGNPLNTLSFALKKIADIPNVKIIQVSRFYQTSPIGDKNQPTYINLACHLFTYLNPKILLQNLQLIEFSLGKVAKPKTAPRPVDIDLIFYGNLSFFDAELEIPHPYWKERLFVLVPLNELISEIAIDFSGQTKNYFIEDLRVLLSNSDQIVVPINEVFYDIQSNSVNWVF